MTRRKQHQHIIVNSNMVRREIISASERYRSRSVHQNAPDPVMTYFHLNALRMRKLLLRHIALEMQNTLNGGLTP